MLDSSTQFTQFYGIGPIEIPETARLSNQQEIIGSLVTIVEQLSSVAPVPFPNSESPHHVLSILGGRGTGKTSLLITLVKQLAHGKHNALILDILQADQLRQSFPVVPAIVALVENYLEAHISREDSQDFLRQHTLSLKKLAWATQSPELLHVLSRDTLNMADWNTKVFELIGQPTDLPGKFRDWITALLRLTGKSLIIIPIDDTDISVDNASKVVESIRIYLSDARIVTIVAADMYTLERRMRNSRLAALPAIPEPKTPDKNTSHGYLFGLSAAQYQTHEARAEQEYVESMLVKVLPPATRFIIQPIPPSERVEGKFYLPGQLLTQSLYSLVAEAETRLGATSPTLAELLLRHPDLLSENLRIFTNQFVLIRGECLSAQSVSPSPAPYVFSSGARYVAPVLSSRSGGEWMRIPDPTQPLLSTFYARILHSLMCGNEFRSLESGIISRERVNLRQLSTIHEIASATIEASRFAGVRTEQSGRRSIYRIHSYEISDTPGSSFVDFCIDYALANGASLESLNAVINFRFETLTRISYPVPIPLFGELKSGQHNQLPQGFYLVSNPHEKTVGGDLVVKSSRDLLTPVFIQDSLDLGVYIGNIPDSTRDLLRRNLHQMSVNLAAVKTSEARGSAIEHTYLSLVGSITLDAFLTLNAAVHTVARGEGVVSVPFFIEWSESTAWVIKAVDDFHLTLCNVFSARTIAWPKRLGLLSFIADMPLQHLHDAIPGVNDELCDKLRVSVAGFLDELDNNGFLGERETGSLDLGNVAKDSASQMYSLFSDAKRLFPSILPERKISALRSLLKTLRLLKPTKSWDYRVAPPLAWHEASDAIAASFRGRRGRTRTTTN